MSTIEIAIATHPASLSLEQEIRLLKPALLYADHVTLYSPAAGMLTATRAIGELGGDQMVGALREVLPLVAKSAGTDQLVPVLAQYDALRNKKRKTRQEINAIFGIQRALAQGAKEIVEKLDAMLEDSGAGEIVPAVNAGLVTIDPILREGDVGEDAFFSACMDRFKELLLSGHAYPLLDEGVAGLVDASLREGIWHVGRDAVRRGKRVTAASEFMEYMPAFPEASISEVLDGRGALRGPLVRFRAAMVEIERLIDSAAYEDGFEAEVQDVFVEKIAPALQEIQEAIQDDRYLRQLTGVLVGDAKTYAKACITLCLALFTQMPDLLAVATGVGASATAAAVQAQWRKSVAAKEIERHQMFFLYKLDKLLERNRAA